MSVGGIIRPYASSVRQEIMMFVMPQIGKKNLHKVSDYACT